MGMLKTLNVLADRLESKASAARAKADKARTNPHRQVAAMTEATALAEAKAFDEAAHITRQFKIKS